MFEIQKKIEDYESRLKQIEEEKLKFLTSPKFDLL